MSLVRHFDEDLILVSHQFADAQVTLKFGVSSVVREDAMLSLKCRTVLVPTVSNEERDVIEPRIARCSREHDPAISPGNGGKSINPGSCPDHSLFVEDEEGILDVLVFRDVIPRIDRENASNRRVGGLAHGECYELLLPVEGVSFLGCGDDVDIARGFVPHVVCGCRDRLPCTYATPQDLSITKLCDSCFLVLVELRCHHSQGATEAVLEDAAILGYRRLHIDVREWTREYP